jgi:hypothetical protein
MGQLLELTVDPLSVVVNNLLDQTHILQSPHGLPGKGAVDLHTLDQNGLRDHLVGRNLLQDLVANEVHRCLAINGQNVHCSTLTR